MAALQELKRRGMIKISPPPCAEGLRSCQPGLEANQLCRAAARNCEPLTTTSLSQVRLK